MRSSTSTSPPVPSAKVSRGTPWRTTDAAVISGVSLVIAAGSARHAERRRWQHPQELRRKLLACSPILEAHEVAIGRIEFPQPELRLLGDDRRWVIALKAKPGDV